MAANFKILSLTASFKLFQKKLKRAASVSITVASFGKCLEFMRTKMIFASQERIAFKNLIYLSYDKRNKALVLL